MRNNVYNLGNRESLLRYKHLRSELFFAKSQNHSIKTIDAMQLAAQDITVIYLSFTNVRISIALPGCNVSFEGGASATRARRLRA